VSVLNRQTFINELEEDDVTKRDTIDLLDLKLYQLLVSLYVHNNEKRLIYFAI